MTASSIGVAVIGAGMVGRAHANAYRNSSTVFDLDHPAPRLVAIADVHEPFATEAARRYGFDRAETDWRAVIDAPDIDAVSVAVANNLHREIVDAALAAGKHVLCEKPLAPSVDDAQSMVDAAAATDRVAAVGFTLRRSPAINAIREQIVSGVLGPVRHVVGNYWTDYGHDPQRPMSWRYLGGPGSGVLADIGSHMVDLAEFLCGPTTSVQGAGMSTLVTDRPQPLGVAVGHSGGVAVSDVRVPVENEDIRTFTTTYGNGALGTFSLSRVALGHANTLRLDVFCENGTASFDLVRPGEFTIVDNGPATAVNGIRQVFIGPWHPYIAKGLPMDFPTVGHGQNDFFVYQARAFLDETLKILGELGLTGAEINAGGFLPAPHLPIADILASPGAGRTTWLGSPQAGITLTGLNVNGNPLNGLQPGDPVTPRRADERHARGRGDAPQPPVLAVHRPRRRRRAPGRPGLPRGREGHPDQRRERARPRGARRPVHPVRPRIGTRSGWAAGTP